MEQPTKQEIAEGHMRLALLGILQPFDSYGQGVFIPEAINAIIAEFKRWGKDMERTDEH